jgi:hypothetical protein
MGHKEFGGLQITDCTGIVKILVKSVRKNGDPAIQRAIFILSSIFSFCTTNGMG